MKAYLPTSVLAIVVVSTMVVMTLAAGYAIVVLGTRRFARWAAWMLVVAAVAGVERLTSHEPPGFRMLAIIAVLLYAMKAVVGVEVRRQGAPMMAPGRWLGFAALWPGMRPGPFSRRQPVSQPGAGELVRRGTVRMMGGVALAFGAHLAWTTTGSRWLATAILLPSLSLIVHFGVFDILAGAWRTAGVDCKPLFRSPLQSTSLGEFWGRRWNLAFSEMTSIAIYQPMVRRVGRRPALAASFLGSGLLHEMAISVPVLAGFGLPLLYFLLHGVLLTVEERLAKASRPIDRRPWIGRVWTFFWIIAPLPILFHRPFLEGIVWPLIGIGPR